MNAKTSESNVIRVDPVTSAPPFDFAREPWTRCSEHAPFVFLQSDLPVSEQTRIRILRDDTRLYIGVECALEKPVPTAGDLGYEGEHVEIFVDTDNSQKWSTQFTVNCSGGFSALDSHRPGSDTTHALWWSGSKAETRCSDTKWEALVTIPLPHPPATDEVWGLNIYRCHVNLRGNSSWCSYSEGFDAPAEFGNMVFGAGATMRLPAHRRPVSWPKRVPKKLFDYHLTIDPPDDFRSWYLDPERLDGYFQFFAGWGVKRAYWIDYGPYTDSFTKIWGKQWGAEVSDRIDRSMATFQGDPLPYAIRAAHKAGMELYCEVKPWDWGSCLIFPPNRLIPGEKGLERIGGLAYPTRVFAEHPGWNMTRSPVGCDDDGRAIAEIVLTKNDDGPVPFPVNELTVWASDDNTAYRRVPNVAVTEAVENAPILRKTFAGAEALSERRAVRVIRLRGLAISQRYVAVEVPGRRSRFQNRAFALVRAFDNRGLEISSSIGNLSINGDWGGSSKGWKTDGIYFEMSEATSQPGGLWKQWSLDNSYGVIGLARGRNRYTSGCPEPAHPEAADWILGWARRAIDLKADGFEYRVRGHQIASEWEAYGYSPEVQTAFRKAMGRDLRPDGTDFAALCEFRGEQYTEILRKAKTLCGAAGLPLGLQVTVDLCHELPETSNMGVHFDWRKWIREGIADQMLAKYISPFSPIFREVWQESKKAVIPFYVEFERHFANPNMTAIFQNWFDAARRAGADAVNIYEGANVARIDEGGKTVSRHPSFTEFVCKYPHA